MVYKVYRKWLLSYAFEIVEVPEGELQINFHHHSLAAEMRITSTFIL